MTGLTLAAVVQAALVATTSQYSDAHATVMKTGRTMVVLVGADWCPACRTMKTQVLPVLRRRGVLSRVEFAVVDTERQGSLARRLMQGGSIPQLVMYRKTSEGWKPRRLIGAQSVGAVEAFIASGAADAEVAGTDRSPNASAMGD